MSKHQNSPNPGHDEGLAHDLEAFAKVTLARRRFLKASLGVGLLGLFGCSANTGNSQCPTIPQETAGPFPGDGTIGPNVLALSGVVRQDIRTSIGGPTNTAEGIPLTVNMTLINSSSDACAPLAGTAVYIWQCDREARYSMYSEGVTDQNYLRGVQETDSQGKVTFQTIFPGCYAGRWPHIHFETFPNLSAAATPGSTNSISQLAFPKEPCEAVYATTEYAQSATELAKLSLESDGVFRDGYTAQLASVTGDNTQGYTATLTVNIKA